MLVPPKTAQPTHQAMTAVHASSAQPGGTTLLSALPHTVQAHQTRPHLEDNHGNAQNELPGAVSKAPQRPQQGCPHSAAPNSEWGQRLQADTRGGGGLASVAAAAAPGLQQSQPPAGRSVLPWQLLQRLVCSSLDLLLAGQRSVTPSSLCGPVSTEVAADAQRECINRCLQVTHFSTVGLQAARATPKSSKAEVGLQDAGTTQPVQGQLKIQACPFSAASGRWRGLQPSSLQRHARLQPEAHCQPAQDAGVNAQA